MRLDLLRINFEWFLASFAAIFLTSCGVVPFFSGGPLGSPNLILSSLEFGQIYRGATVTGLITVTNIGGDIATSLAATSLSSPFQFTGNGFPGSNGTCSDTLPAGQSCTIEISIHALTAEAVLGSLVISFANSKGRNQASQNLSATIVDAAFNLATGLDGPVNSIAVANDGSGKYYVAGDFVSYNSMPAPRLVRFNTDGTLDTTFNVGLGPDASVTAVVPAVDGSGSIYIGGAFTHYNGSVVNLIARVTSTGALDPSFTSATGFTYFLSFAPATDGSFDLYVGGWNDGGFTGPLPLTLARLTPTGAIDGTFAIGSGPTNVFVFNPGQVYSIAVAPDGTGDIVIAGFFSQFNGVNAASLARIHSDGSLSNAIPASGSGIPTKIAPSNDGSGDLYISGLILRYGATAVSSFIKISAAGALDTDFGLSDGLAIFVPFSLAIDGTHDFYFDSGPTFTRYHANGTVNGSFAAPSCTGVNALASLADGSVIAGGTFQTCGGAIRNRLARFDSSGNLQGVSEFKPRGGFNSVSALARSGGDKGYVYVAGPGQNAVSNFLYDGVPYNGLVRLNLDGTVDSTFKVGSGFPGGSVSAILLPNDGSEKVYLGGSFTSYQGMPAGGIIRLNSDGSVDSSFVTGTGFDGAFSTMSLVPDGSGDLWVGGTFAHYNGTPVGAGQAVVVKLHANGLLDTSFSALFDYYPLSIAAALDGSGGIYVAGQFATVNGLSSPEIVRLNSDGSVDTGFTVGTGLDYAYYQGGTLTVLPATDGSGKIYVGGSFTKYGGALVNGIVRLNSDGSIDSSFATGTGFENIGGPVNAFIIPVNNIALAEGGSQIYVMGASRHYNGIPINYVVRLNSDGSLDTNFTASAGAPPNLLIPANDGTGDIYVGATTGGLSFGLPGFSSWAGVTTDAVARVSSTGQVY